MTDIRYTHAEQYSTRTSKVRHIIFKYNDKEYITYPSFNSGLDAVNIEFHKNIKDYPTMGEVSETDIVVKINLAQQGTSLDKLYLPPIRLAEIRVGEGITGTTALVVCRLYIDFLFEKGKLV